MIAVSERWVGHVGGGKPWLGEPLLAILCLAAEPNQPPALWPVAMLTGIGVGMALWFLGPRVARPGFGALGLVAGGIGAGAAYGPLGGHGALLLWVTVGSVGGFLLAIAMIRVWVAVSCALVLAVSVPVVSLIWTRTALPPLAGSPFIHAVVAGVQQNPRDWRQRVGHAYQEQQTSVQAWWSDLTSPTRRTLALAACAGGVIGLVAGLVYPRKMAIFESEWIGSTLVLCGVYQLAFAYVPGAHHWPSDRFRVMLVLLGLITLLGCLVQWTIFKPKTDR